MAEPLIGTSFVGARRGQVSTSPTPAMNPATGAALDPPYHWAAATDIEEAIAAATEAFSTFGRLSGKAKGTLLRTIAEKIEGEADAIVARANQETALPPARIQAEMGRTCGQLRLFATLVESGWWVDARIDHADPSRKPVPKPDVRSMLRPLGPVAVFSSSNFPLAFSVAGGDTASALAAGCPVIVKPHQGHLGTSELVAQAVRRAVEECGHHPGVFSMLFGQGAKVGMALVKDHRIKAVGFTGSRAGGRAIMDAAAARAEPIPVYTEMGSINPVFLLPQALKERGDALATGLHGSVTLGVGQFCTNPGLVFVPAGVHEPFIRKLAELMGATPEGTMLTPGICQSFREGVARFAASPGVQTIARVTPGPGDAQAGAALFTTTANQFLSNPQLMDELFGPATLIVVCPDPPSMRVAAGHVEGQLTATIHGTDAEIAEHQELVSILESKVGRIVFNGFPTGVEVCHAMHHGGPYPATSDGRSTSVGTRAITRFAKPVCYQNCPDASLLPDLQEGNPLGIPRLVDGQWVS